MKVSGNVTEISFKEFYGCDNLQEVVVVIENGVKTIKDEAFCNCLSLPSITFPETLTSIGKGAFGNNYALTSLMFPDGLTSIGDLAFSSCWSLNSITFPKTLTSIGEHAFFDCYGLCFLTSRNLVPPVCGGGAFRNIDKRKCTLYVPTMSINSYKTAPEWEEFLYISGEAPLGIDDINGGQFGGFEIETVGGNALRIGGAEGRGVEVYGVDGRCEWRTGSYDGAAVELTPGMHIVRVGDRSVKVML